MNKEVTPIILSAGRGSRLGLNDMPKPMASVHGRPLMQSAVESLFGMAYGPGEIVAVLGFQERVIRGYFGADLAYCHQKDLNGNAGALISASRLFKGQGGHVLAIQGDDAAQATAPNLRHLINSHLATEADVSILTINRPDPEAHRKEYVYRPNGGRVTGYTSLATRDAHGRYTAGIYLFSREFLNTYLPKLKDMTPPGQEMGISQLVKLAIDDGRKVFLTLSAVPYVSVNTPRGLQIARQK